MLLVVHCLPPDEHTGTPLVAYGYATALARAGWAVTVMSMGADAPPWEDLQIISHRDEPFARVPVRPTTHAGSVWTVDAPATPLDPTPSAPLDPSAVAAFVSSNPSLGLPRWLSAAKTAETIAPHGPDAAFRQLLRRLRPSVVHVVDNVHLPLSIPELAHDAGVPVVRTVACAEDLCALIAPVSPCSGADGYCAAPLTVSQCATCVSHSGDPAWVHFAADERPTVDSWRQERLRGLLRAKRARAVTHYTSLYDRVVFASPGFRIYFEQTLPLDSSRTRTIPMGVDLPAALGTARSGSAEPASGSAHAAPATDTASYSAHATRDTDLASGSAHAGPRADTASYSAPGDDLAAAHRPAGSGARRAGHGATVRTPLTFVLLATADPAKGIGAVVDAFTAAALAGRDDWRLILAGGGERRRFGALLDDWRVTDHGPYRPEDLPRLLGGADVGLSTSVFETFHRVTREYLAAGLPVVGATTFGISDVVVHGTNGLRFEHRDPGALRRALLALLEDRALVAHLRRGARSTAIRSVEEEVADIATLYRELLDERRR